MLKKLVIGDLRRSSGSSVVLTLLIALAALLATLSAIVLGQLIGSMSHLNELADPPDVVQMHSGEMDVEAFEQWASSNPLIDQYQAIRTLPIGNEAIAFNGKTDPADQLEPMFVTQSTGFDLLIGLDDKPVDPQPGEVAIPLHYRDARDIAIGDPIEVTTSQGIVELKVVAFLRDAQMNSSLVTSKRFVVNHADYDKLDAAAPAVEYLIEMKLHESANATKVGNQYTQAGMPANGVQITGAAMTLINGMSHGLVIALVALVALLLIAVTLLSIRLTFLTAMERDRREIGIMKAIGVPGRRIKLAALVKYLALGVVGCVIGLVIALIVGRSLTVDITEYYGTPGGTWLQWVLPPIAALSILVLIIAFCWRLLRRYDRMTALDGLREAPSAIGRSGAQRMRLVNSRRLPARIWMGLSSVAGNIGGHLLLVLMLTLSVFMIVIPVNLATTVASPSFATYLGVGDSDLRIDLRAGDAGIERYRAIEAGLRDNPKVERTIGHIAVRYEMVARDGSTEPVPVENGDQTTFPMAYISGEAPQAADEIALSALQADALEVKAGDTVEIRTAAHGTLNATVTGIYQDVTNGGKTARGDLPIDGEPVLWFNITFDAAGSAQPQALAAGLAAEYPDARVTVVKEYANRNFGETISQVTTAAVVCAAAALALAFLITALFARMVLAADDTKIAIQRAIGTSDRSIRVQYLVRFAVPLLIALVLGVVLAHYLGGLLLAKGAGAMIGAPQIAFIVEPLLVFVAVPLALGVVVLAATSMSTARVATSGITSAIQE